MSQPQNPWGQQQQIQQQLPPGVKPLPRNWQKPIEPTYQQQQQPVNYYQPQPQFVPAGYYGQQQPPEAVKQWPWWATMILVFVVFGGIAFYAVYTGKSGSQDNKQQVIATIDPLQRTGQAAPTIIPASNIGRVGETIALNGYTITINEVQKAISFDSGEVFKAKEDYIYIAVDVTVGSNKAKGVSSNGLYSSVKDSRGFKYDVSILGSKIPLLPGESDIPPGGKSRGWLTFEVPKTATGLVFEYAQLFESEKIRVALN